MGKGGTAFPRLIFFAVGAPFQKRGSAGSPTGRWGRTGNRPAGTAPPCQQPRAAAKWSGRSEGSARRSRLLCWKGDGVPPSSSMTGTGSNAGAADASSTGALCTGAGVSSRTGLAVEEEAGREVPAEPAETGEGRPRGRRAGSGRLLLPVNRHLIDAFRRAVLRGNCRVKRGCCFPQPPSFSGSPGRTPLPQAGQQSS